MTASAPTALKAQVTLEKARGLLDSGRGAALPGLVKLVATLSADIEKLSISELVESIEPDAVLLARILAVANKLPQNPQIARICTLSQAVHRIGFASVRNTALSLLLLDQTAERQSPEQREAAELALTAGLLAHGASARLGTQDPEIAFACASLRNLGRILMAAISPALYREAVELGRLTPPVDGFRRCFGLGPLELSRKITANHKLPELAVQALREGEPESLPGAPGTQDAHLLAIADYSCRLASLVLDSREPDQGFVRKVTQLAKRYRRNLPGLEDVAVPALIGANAQLRAYVRGGAGEALPVGNLQRIRHRLEVLAPGEAGAAERAEQIPVRFTAAGIPDPAGAPPPAVNPNQAAPQPKEPEPKESVPAEKEPPPSPMAPAAATEIAPPTDWTDSLPESAIISVSSPVPVADSKEDETLELMRAAAGSSELWWFRSGQKGELFARHRGLGAAWKDVPASASVPAGERNVFSLAIDKGEVVLIHDASAPALRAYLPAWWPTLPLAPPSFALVPVAQGAGRSLLVAAWPEKRQVALSAAQATLLRRLAAGATLD
jgi:hypothetical protein